MAKFWLFEVEAANKERGFVLCISYFFIAVMNTLSKAIYKENMWLDCDSEG